MATERTQRKKRARLLLLALGKHEIVAMDNFIIEAMAERLLDVLTADSLDSL